jgi:cellulose synthase/poly-beta-1,6-N-acetylglucosamine synthase-like glycosyltransferase
MGWFVGPLAYAQIAFSLLMMPPILYWISMKISKVESVFSKNLESKERRISIILPMRNEVTNVERKISEILNEILPHDFVDLVVANSNSNDGTGEIARKILESSEMDQSRWKVMDFGREGKNVALNGVLEETDAEIVVISDADAKVSSGWLDIVRSRMEEDDVGVVSGVEKEADNGNRGFNEYYREKSNWLRIRESEIDSTPVLEGSLLAWKTSALGNFVLNERMNADDAQICLICIRSGFRAILDERISFGNFEDLPNRTFRESVRRSQGLSIALLRNADLAIIGHRKKARLAIANALFLYLIFPWSAILFCANAIFAFSMDPEIGYSWDFYSIISISFVMTLPSGRFVARGALISVVAHGQAILGSRYQNWDPVR